MNLYQVTFDTSTVLVLAADYDQLYECLKKLDSKYWSEGHYELYYHWDEDTRDKCDIKVIDLNKVGIVSAVAH